MADNTLINAPSTPGQTIATKDIGGVNHELVILEFSDGAGGATEVSAASPLPVADAAVLAKLSADPATQTTLAAVLAKLIAAPATEATLAAIAALLSNQQTDALTDAELRASPVPVSGTVTTGGLTDAQLRATPVPISGTVAIDASLLATGAKQDSQTALLTTLNSLIETNNYLVQFLSQLTGAMNSGAPALRTTPIASVSTAVTGSLTSAGTVTSVGSITNFGTGIPASEMAHDINNFTVTLANINNVTA
jgi:hypothetical protein